MRVCDSEPLEYGTFSQLASRSVFSCALNTSILVAVTTLSGRSYHMGGRGEEGLLVILNPLSMDPFLSWPVEVCSAAP